MPYIITSACIDIKDKSCMQECPVDCIYEGESMTYINPEQCIDCGACEPVCPAGAIYHEEDVPNRDKVFIEINKSFFSNLNLEQSNTSTFAKIDHPYVSEYKKK